MPSAQGLPAVTSRGTITTRRAACTNTRQHQGPAPAPPSRTCAPRPSFLAGGRRRRAPWPARSLWSDVTANTQMWPPRWPRGEVPSPGTEPQSVSRVPEKISLLFQACSPGKRTVLRDADPSHRGLLRGPTPGRAQRWSRQRFPKWEPQAPRHRCHLGARWHGFSSPPRTSPRHLGAVAALSLGGGTGAPRGVRGQVAGAGCRLAAPL